MQQNISTFINDIRTQGVLLSIDGKNSLRVKGKITTEQKDILRQRKQEIIELLALPPLETQPAPENVFELESGQKVISYFCECARKYQESEKTFYLGLPTIEAYKTELALVEAIRQRETGEISQLQLKQAADNYTDAHLAPAIPAQWTGDEVPLFYLRLFLNGEESHAFTCNKIQAQIITAFWQTTQPETTAQITRL